MPANVEAAPLYRCDVCGHVCTEGQMKADFCYDHDDPGSDEVWSNWICPNCGRWHEGSDDLSTPGKGWTKVGAP